MFKAMARRNSILSKRLNTVTVLLLLLTLILSALDQNPVLAQAPAAAANKIDSDPPPTPEVQKVQPYAEPKLPSLTVQIEYNTPQVAVGETTTAVITVTNLAAYPANDFKLNLTLPAGTKVEEKDSSTGTATKTGWEWTQPVFEGNATVSFTANITVQSMPPGEALFLQAQVSSREIKNLGPAVGGAIVVDNNLDETPATSSFVPGKETKLKADNNPNGASGVEVNFGPKAYSKPLTLKKLSRSLKEPELKAKNVAAPPQTAGYKKGLNTFFLEAADDLGQPVTKFDEDVNISLHYTAEQLRALNIAEGDLTLFWFDDTHEYYAEDGKTKLPGKWISVDTTIDPTTHTATAQVNHFTAYQFADGSSPSSAYLPSLQGFQTNLYTGAANYNIPIEVPPGPAGIKPSLNMSYNSTATDGKAGQRLLTQASWVGKGWSLDTPSISYNKQGDYFSLVLDSQSNDIFKGALISTDPNGTKHYAWQSSNEGYTKIISNEPTSGVITWSIWSKDGTRYDFLDNAKWGWGHYGTACDNNNPPNCWRTGQGDYSDTQVYKYLLTKVVDINGNTINYNYGRIDEIHDCTTSPCAPGHYAPLPGWNYVTLTPSIWPDSITWGGNINTQEPDRFKVNFLSTLRQVDNVCESASSLEYQEFGAYCERRQLNAIQIMSMRATSWELISQYNLAYDPNSPILSDAINNGAPVGYNKLTLSSVQRVGSDGVTALPATTFTYGAWASGYPYGPGGWNRLTGVNNGQGGTITIAYEVIAPFVAAWNYLDFNNNRRITSKTLTDGRGNSYTWTYSGYQNAVYNSLGITLAGNWYGPSATTNSAALYYNKYVVTGDISDRLAHRAKTEFRGHSYVKETAPDGTQIEHWFYQGYGDCNGDGTYDNPTGTGYGIVNNACFQILRDQENLKGKEYRTRVLSSTGAVYTDTFNTYQVNFLDYGADPVSGVWHFFTNVSRVDSKNYEGNGAGTPQAKTVKYYYETGQQGGTQYGNVTTTEEYDASVSTTVPYRTTRNWFVILDNSSNYIVNRPVSDVKYDGAGNITAQTHYLYDNTSTVFGIGTKGQLTLTRQFFNFPLLPSALNFPLQATDTSFGYDTYGNKTTVTTYASPGTALNTSSGWTEGAPGNGSAATTTTTTYDSTFHLFPTQTTYPTVNGVQMVEKAEYDYTMGLLTKIIDPNNNETSAEYDVYGRIVKQYKPGDTSTYPTWYSVYYDNAIPFRYTYFQREESGASGGYRSSTTIYDGLGRQIQAKQETIDGTATTGQNLVTDTVYDSMSRVSKTSQPRYVNENTSGTFWTFTPRSSDDVNVMRWTTTTYDAVGRAYDITAPDGTKTSHRYTLAPETSGVMTLRDNVIDANRHRSHQRYDVFGRVLYSAEISGDCGAWEFTCGGSYTTTWAGVATTSYSYNSLDQLTQVTDQNGNKTATIYDSLGRKLYTQDPDLGSWSYNYDANGSLVKQTDAKGQSISFTYDALNRPISKSTQAAPSQTFSDTFDTQNNTNWTFNNTYQTVPFNDGGNNVVKNVGTGDYSSNFYRNSYSLSNGNSVQVRFKTDNTGSSAHFGIEANDATYRRFAAIVGGGKLQAQFINGTTTNYPAAEILSGVQANTWYVIKFVLDDTNGFSIEVYQENNPSLRGYYKNLNLPTGKTWRFHHWSATGNTYLDDYKEFSSSNPTTVSNFSYDVGTNGKGKLTSSSNAYLTTSTQYDNRGRTSQITYSNIFGLPSTTTRSFQWTYDSADRVKSVVYPDLGTGSETLNYTYDSAWNATSMCTGANQTGYCYVSNTQSSIDSYQHISKQSMTFGNGLIQRLNFSGLVPRLQSIQIGTTSTATDRLNRSFTYDNVGNIKTINDGLVSQSFNFDYDYLNRLTLAHAGPDNGTDTGYNETYSYDVIGNITVKAGVNYTYPATGLAHPHAPVTVGSKSYSYDANGNLLSDGTHTNTWNVDNQPNQIDFGSNSEAYYYSVEGARVGRTHDGIVTSYMGLLEEDSNGTYRFMYKFGGNIVAQRTVSGSQNILTYLLSDQQGSVSVATKGSDGTFVDPTNPQQKFDPWGKVRQGNLASTGTTTINYTGQKLDSTGLLYYNARYYDPSLGKFISPDTANDGLNRYSYVGNNPINRTDPTGHCEHGEADDVCRQMLRNSPRLDDFADIDIMDRISLNRLWNWLSRGVRFRRGDIGWTMQTIDAAMQGLERVYNAFSELFGANQADHRMEQGLGFAGPTGLTININNSRLTTADGRPITSGDYNPQTNVISLFFAPADAYVRAGENSFDRLSHITIHEIGHTIDNNLSIINGWHRDGDELRTTFSVQAWRLARAAGGTPASNYNTGWGPDDFAETFTAWVNSRASNHIGWRTGYQDAANGNGPNRPDDDRVNALTGSIGCLVGGC